MGKINLEQLKALRESTKQELASCGADPNSVHIMVGMGTSGIAAGARATLDALEAEIKEHDLPNVTVRQTGSLGLDHAEPTVEICMADMPRVIYGKVTPEIAEKIVRKHVMGKSLINDHIFDRPAADILADKEQN